MKRLIFIVIILSSINSIAQTGGNDLFLIKTDSLNLLQLKEIIPDSTKVLTIDGSGGIGYTYGSGSVEVADSTWKEATVIDTLYFKDTTSKIYKDVTSGELTFKDSVSGAQKLSELIGGGSTSTFSGVAAYFTAQKTTTGLIPWTVEIYDTDSYHSTSSNTDRFYAPSDGYYHISAMLLTYFTYERSMELILKINGTDTNFKSKTYVSHSDGEGSGELSINIPLPISAVVYLNSGDYVSINSSGSVYFPGADNYFYMYKL